MPGGKKSRDGCIACKKKKVKCDAQRPHCLRCQRIKKPCPGYNQDLRWSDKHEVLTKHSTTRVRSRNSQNEHQYRKPAINASQPYNLDEAAEIDCAQVFIGVQDGTLQNVFGSVLSDVDIDTDEALWSTNLLEPVDFPSPTFGMLDAATSQGVYGSQNSRGSLGSACQDQQFLHGLWNRNSFYFDTLDQTLAPTVLVPRSPKPSLICNPVDQNSVLVEYYFSVVASFYSCFDGNLNPFRTTVGRLWSSSESMMLTLKSMAAACLSRDFPYLAKEGMAYRNQAVQQINNDIMNGCHSDTSILCLIMLGQSAGWHHVADLGLRQFQSARKLLGGSMVQNARLPRSSQNSPFFNQALHYWEMILSFVSDIEEEEDQDSQISPDSEFTTHTMPHPWALIAPEMMNTISKVGRLVYSHRKMVRNQRFWKKAHIADIEQKISMAKQMERSLLFNRLPTEDEIIDPGDTSTPVSHLLAVAEAYRLIALIQLYRVFPDVLFERLQSTEQNFASSNIPLHCLSSSSQISETDAQEWLKQLVQRAIDILSIIPFESHTRSIQAFLYVALSSEIRKPKTIRGFNHETVQVMEARNLIRSRLEAYRFVFAHKPAQRKVDLVLKVWDQMDSSDTPVYWMDVMIDNDLGVVFC